MVRYGCFGICCDVREDLSRLYVRRKVGMSTEDVNRLLLYVTGALALDVGGTNTKCGPPALDYASLLHMPTDLAQSARSQSAWKVT